jgi:hypothetical protein
MNQSYQLSEILNNKYWIQQAAFFAQPIAEIVALINANNEVTVSIDDELVHPFLNFRAHQSSADYSLLNLFWINEVDETTPYDTGYQGKLWVVSLLFSDACSTSLKTQS